MGEPVTLQECEMLKALYDFDATFAKTLSFAEGDLFFLYQVSSKQRNWWHVVNRHGQIGFVPSNYVTILKVEPEFLISFLDKCLTTLKSESLIPQQKQELISRLQEKKRNLQSTIKPPSKKPPAPKPPARFDDVSSPNGGVSPCFDLRPIVSEQSLNDNVKEAAHNIETDIKAYNVTVVDSKSLPEQRSGESRRPRHSASSPLRAPPDEPESDDVIQPNAIYELVQSVRKETQLSHELSKVAVETVLISLREFLPGGAARSIVDALLREANSNMRCPKNAMDAAPDALRMMTALNALSKAANDAQQRGWALHDDAHDIQTQLIELISVMTSGAGAGDARARTPSLSRSRKTPSSRSNLMFRLAVGNSHGRAGPTSWDKFYASTIIIFHFQSNADVNISQHVLSGHKYAYVTILVQYYQMETRWPLRQLLLQAFGVMCGLERTALATLAVSPLPAEIARDMTDNPREVARLSHSALLLSMVLSMADKLPVTHFDQMGVEFAQFLLDLIESPPETDVNEQIPDLFLTLLLAYNLQFPSPTDNLLLDALQSKETAKTFTEKVLLLLNREEDPVRLFDHEPAPPHSVLKLVSNLFSRRATADHFYTNDVKVMTDILVRQLADLSPGDTRRQQYLKLCQGMIRNTDYGSHLHRRDDLLRCFSRIFCEETEASRADQTLVRAISNEFPQYFKT